LPELLNLVVDLDERFTSDASDCRQMAGGVRILSSESADDTTLAWIDETFGGWWSSEAFAARNVVAMRENVPIGFAAFDPQGLHFRWLRGLAREPGVGVFGPFGVATQARGTGLGRSLLRLALTGLRARGYSQALVAGVGENVAPYYAMTVGARVAERLDRSALLAPPPRAVVLASGSGSNFQAVAERVAAGSLPIELIGVVTNRPQAGVVERARAARVGLTLLPWHRNEETRAQYDAKLLDTVAEMAPDLILLLGWMHLLDERFVETFPNLVNVHPAFLPLDPERDEVGLPDATTMPAFRGVAAVRDAMQFGAGWIGATVHLVTPQTDRGPVLARRPLCLEPGEDEARVMRRLHPLEHELVATAIVRRLYERA
jgi:phosphoribosylglycinamide formyltransferase-1